MAQGIKWVDGIKIFRVSHISRLEDKVNEWLEEHKLYSIKSIKLSEDEQALCVLVHYQKPSGEWE